MGHVIQIFGIFPVHKEHGKNHFRRHFSQTKEIQDIETQAGECWYRHGEFTCIPTISASVRNIAVARKDIPHSPGCSQGDTELNVGIMKNLHGLWCGCVVIRSPTVPVELLDLVWRDRNIIIQWPVSFSGPRDVDPRVEWIPNIDIVVDLGIRSILLFRSH